MRCWNLYLEVLRVVKKGEFSTPLQKTPKTHITNSSSFLQGLKKGEWIPPPSTKNPISWKTHIYSKANQVFTCILLLFFWRKLQSKSHFWMFFFIVGKTYIQSLSDQIHSRFTTSFRRAPILKSHAKDEIIFVFRKLRKIISMICIKTLKTRIYSGDFGCLSLILISFINKLVQIDVND